MSMQLTIFLVLLLVAALTALAFRVSPARTWVAVQAFVLALLVGGTLWAIAGLLSEVFK